MIFKWTKVTKMTHDDFPDTSTGSDKLLRIIESALACKLIGVKIARAETVWGLIPSEAEGPTPNSRGA